MSSPFLSQNTLAAPASAVPMATSPSEQTSNSPTAKYPLARNDTSSSIESLSPQDNDSASNQTPSSSSSANVSDDEHDSTSSDKSKTQPTPISHTPKTKFNGIFTTSRYVKEKAMPRRSMADPLSWCEDVEEIRVYRADERGSEAKEEVERWTTGSRRPQWE